MVLLKRGEGMDKKEILYRPNRQYIFFSCLSFFMGIVSFALLFIGKNGNIKSTLTISSMGLVSFLLSFYIYKAYKKYIVFDEDGVSVFEGKRKGVVVVPWEKITYAYYTRNFKGFHFLLLSSKNYSEKQARKITNRAINREKLFFDGNIVFNVDYQKQVNEQIKLLVENKVGPIIDQRDFYW